MCVKLIQFDEFNLAQKVRSDLPKEDPSIPIYLPINCLALKVKSIDFLWKNKAKFKCFSFTMKNRHRFSESVKNVRQEEVSSGKRNKEVCRGSGK